MEKRLEEKGGDSTYTSLIYEHGTHFVFPQSMLNRMLPVFSGLFVRMMFSSARQFPKECRRTREDIDRRLRTEIENW